MKTQNEIEPLEGSDTFAAGVRLCIALILSLLGTALSSEVRALPLPEAETCDSVSLQVYFTTGQSELDSNLYDNKSRITEFDAFCQLCREGRVNITNVNISGYASPDGSPQFNKGIARQRADVMAEYVSRNLPGADSLIHIIYTGID